MGKGAVFAAKPLYRLGHDGKRGKAQVCSRFANVAKSPRHQTAIAPARMRLAEAAHVVMGRVGFTD